MNVHLSDYLDEAINKSIFFGDPFPEFTAFSLALFEDYQTPSDNGAEVSGGSYARQPVSFSLVGDRMRNVSAAQFTNLPACTVVSVGLYGVTNEAVPQVKLLMFGSLSPTQNVVEHDSVAFADGGLSVGWE